MQITTIGLDLAKSVFQVHGIDAAGQVWFASRFGGRKCWHFLASCWHGPPVIFSPSTGGPLGQSLKMMLCKQPELRRATPRQAPPLAHRPEPPAVRLP
jgi:hypothetical protein